MPAVLVETAFIDNDIDALLLMNHQQEIAAAIARGITDYWQQLQG
jgi:N-acetylmuramoyl-L-alanine amidase